MAMDAYIRDRARGDRLFGHVTPSPTHPALGWGEGEERRRQAYLAEHQNTAPYGVPLDPAGSNLGRRLDRSAAIVCSRTLATCRRQSCARTPAQIPMQRTGRQDERVRRSAVRDQVRRPRLLRGPTDP